MKPVKKKRSSKNGNPYHTPTKLKEVETRDKNVTAFRKDKKPFIFEKQVEYHKNQPGDGVLKVKFKGGKKPKVKYISKEKAERQIKRKRKRISRRNK